MKGSFYSNLPIITAEFSEPTYKICLHQRFATTECHTATCCAEIYVVGLELLVERFGSVMSKTVGGGMALRIEAVFAL